jgi:type IV secretory pathway VirB10-like protein
LRACRNAVRSPGRRGTARAVPRNSFRGRAYTSFRRALWGELFKAAALSTILSVGAEAGTSQNENNLVQALRQGASNSVSQTGQQIVSRQLNIAPTLTIRPGFPVRVMVTRDLVLEPYGG